MKKEGTPQPYSPLRIALLYALFGSLWFAVANNLFRLSLENPVLLILLELTSGLGLVYTTSILIYVLLTARERNAKAPVSTTANTNLLSGNRRLVLLLILLILTAPLLGLLIALIQGPRIEHQAFMDLKSIAELKSHQVETWMDERYRDGMSLSQDPVFVSNVAMVLAADDTEAWERVKQQLNSFQSTYDNYTLSLLDASRHIRFHVGYSPTSHEVESDHSPAHLLSEAGVTTGQTYGQLLIRHSHDKTGVHFYIDFPLHWAAQQRPFAMLRIAFQPEPFLYPYITRWSTSSASGETLLAEIQQDQVLFLTPLRHKDAPAGTHTHPLSDSMLPAAVALRNGGSGTLRGKDYRGVEVLAAYHPVEGTSWQLIAKRDRDEIMAPLYTLIIWVSVIGLIAVISIGVLILHIWKQQRQVAALSIEAEKQRSDTLLQQFFDLPFIGIAITSPQSKVWLRFNQRLCEILGYPSEELVEKSWAELTHPDDLQEDIARFEQVMQGTINGYTMDKRFIRKDGKIVDAFIDVKCVRKPDGTVDYFVAMVQDISERKVAEQELKHAKQEAQQYLDIAGVILLALDTEGRIQLVNRRACEILGYEEEELYGQNWFDTCIPVPMRDEVKSVFARLVSGEIDPVEYFENPVLTRNGDERIIAWHNTLVVNEQGQINGILSSGEDITERLSAEQALIANEARLRTLVNTLPDLVWLKDVEGRYLACNPMFERFFGASESAITGKTDYDFVDKTLADFFREHDRKAMAAGRPTANEETLTFAADGYQGTFETVKTPMRDSDGRIIGVLGIARDITERKEALAHLEHLSQLYATLSQTNLAIVRNLTQQELFSDVCRIAVEHGGFKMAWVGLIDDETGDVVPVASHGDETGYIKAIHLSIAPSSPYAKGPTGIAMQKGEAYWCQDFIHSETTQPWHERAAAAGFAASAALPLTRHDKVIGSFNLYAPKANAFSPDIRELLLEMAGDVSYALDHLDHEHQRQQAEERLELVIKGSDDAPWDWDLVKETLWYSPQWWRLLGYTADEMAAVPSLWRELAHPDDLAAIDQMLANIMRPGEEWAEVECRFRHKAGHYIPTLVRAFASRDSQDKVVRLSGTAMDLTALKLSEHRLKQALTGTISAISHTIEKRDPYTAGHQQRVATLSTAIAKHMKLEPGRIEGIQLGSLIHDIGKIYIPAEILNRPGKLSEFEFGLIKSHPDVGYDIIKDVEFDWPIADMVYQHHERIDGSGYPRGLKGDEICLEARIIAVADVVEAMTSHRPYRPGLGLDTALEQIIRESGKTLDSVIVESCLSLFNDEGFSWPDSYPEH